MSEPAAPEPTSPDSAAPTASPSPAPPRKGWGGCLLWPSLAAVLITGILCFTLLRSWDRAKELFATMTGQTNVQISFRENLVKITATKGDILELATVETDETITRRDQRTTFWNIVNLGTTVSSVRMPVVYRYHLKLSDPWTVTTNDRRCVVIAPKIRPSLPPAIRTDKMEKETNAGWARFNAAENLAILEKEITPHLERRAGNQGNIDRVRDPSRKAVAEFVKTWLLSGPQKENVDSITIIFEDEPAAKDPNAGKTLPATVVLTVP